MVREILHKTFQSINKSPVIISLHLRAYQYTMNEKERVLNCPFEGNNPHLPSVLVLQTEENGR